MVDHEPRPHARKPTASPEPPPPRLLAGKQTLTAPAAPFTDAVDVRSLDLAIADLERLRRELAAALDAGDSHAAGLAAARLRIALQLAGDRIPLADPAHAASLRGAREAAAPLLARAPARSHRAPREDRRFVELLGGGAAQASQGPAVNRSLERQLLDYLLHGAAPVVQFENLLFLGLDPDDAIAIHARLTAEPAPHDDALARAFRGKVGAADREAILARLGTFVRDTAGDRMWRELAPGEQTQAMQLVSRVDARDGVHLRSRPAGPKDGAVLPFDTLVAVSRKTARGWYWVTVLGDAAGGTAPAGMSGFVEAYHVASQMPEPTAHLYPVQRGDLLKDIAAKHYKHNFAWGHDARVYVQAIYHANKDRDAVYRERTDLSVDHRALSTKNMKEALELWGAARVVAGQALWIPSDSFVSRLKAAGVIHQASISRTLWDGTAGLISDLIDQAQYIGGFAIGLLEGAWGALEDLFGGVKELIAALWMVIKGIFTGFSELRALAKKLGAAWEKRSELMSTIATDFMKKWESKDDWKRGNFQGEVLGYVMMLALIIMATAGAGGAIAGAGRFGSFVKLIQLADAAGSIGTYVGKLRAAIKLPRQVADQSAEVLGKKLVKGAGDATPDAPHARAHEPSADAPKSPDAPRSPDAPKSPDAPEVRNHGEPYGDPRVDPERPHRYLEKHELPSTSELDLAPTWRQAAKALDNKASVAIGRKLASAAEGHEIVARLARGDASALKQLGIDDVPRKLDTTGREWALVEGRDGFAIVAGQYRNVKLPAGMRILAHNHPGPNPSSKLPAGELPTVDLDVPKEGRTFAELLSRQGNLRDSGLVPSAMDIHAISGGHSHVIYTRFVHRGGGKIANPAPGDTAARVSVHLSGAKSLSANHRTGEYKYRCAVQMKDSSGKVLWSGKLVANWVPTHRKLNAVVFES